MIISKYDKTNQFKALFDTRTGYYMRTGILEDGIDTGKDPFMTDFPELLDIGIMGSCSHGRNGLCISAGVECYQNGLNTCTPNMTLDNFKRIADQCKGRIFQFALGGRGDPDQHESFAEILEYCTQCNIVPNFTSSGLGFTDEIAELCKKHCGAVAVSWYRQAHTLRAIEMLINAGVKTNIHYVLSSNSIEEAVMRLEKGSFPKGINAVIFLLHKPVGQGSTENVLSYADDRVKHFFELIDSNSYEFKIGFDSCTVPALINFTKHLNPNSYDTCEGARWSAYITPDMKMLPCSFDNQELRWAYDISNDTIENAWNSPQFEQFRGHFRTSCTGCKDRAQCMGGCPIRSEVVLCSRAEKH